MSTSLAAVAKLSSVFALLFLAACSTSNLPSLPSLPTNSTPAESVPPVAAPPVSSGVPPTTPSAKILQSARWSDLPGWGEDDFVVAWPAFEQSCQGLASKPQWSQWRGVCTAAKKVDAKNAAAIRQFFESNFHPYSAVNTDGNRNGLVTGYYEPIINGAKTRSERARYPLHGAPTDLLTIELGDVLPELKGKRVRGRLVGNKVVPYWSRAQIGEHGQQFPTLFWAEDPIELFFMQVQGSGRVKLPNGEMVRVAYADHNGHPYQSIGRVLIDRGELKVNEASMQGIQAWARANPAKLDELLGNNPSYVFFRELSDKFKPEDGPPGALGVPLLAERSIAVDTRYIPLGAPVFLATTKPNSEQALRRLVMAQDTGGAIKGVVRADYFWGFGPDAGARAGKMKQSGQMWVLLPPTLAPK